MWAWDLRDLDFLLAAAVAALLLARQAALLVLQVAHLPLQVAHLPLQVARVAGLHGFRAVPAHHHVFDPQVQPDGLPGQRQRLNLDFAGETHEIAPVWRLADRRHFRGAGGDLRPADIQIAELEGRHETEIYAL